MVILTGGALRYVRQACALARLLQPAIVVLEDVDLVARHRNYEEDGNPILFDILNQLDGIADDADIVFVLTTNRADLLEPALAARPGRIDLAVEIPLPGDAGRRRLFRLYGERMRVDGASRTRSSAERPELPLHSSGNSFASRPCWQLGRGDGTAEGHDRHVSDRLDELLPKRARSRAFSAGR